MIDRIDHKILLILQSDGRSSNAEIARKVGLAASAVLERIRKLKERGVILGFGVRIDPAAVGLGLLAFIRVRTDEPLADAMVARQLREVPEVLEVHDVAGDDCYLLKVVARDMASLHSLVRDRIGALSCVRSTATTIVMETVKETAVLPLEDPLKDGSVTDDPPKN